MPARGGKKPGGSVVRAERLSAGPGSGKRAHGHRVRRLFSRRALPSGGAREKLARDSAGPALFQRAASSRSRAPIVRAPTMRPAGNRKLNSRLCKAVYKRGSLTLSLPFTERHVQLRAGNGRRRERARRN